MKPMNVLRMRNPAPSATGHIYWRVYMTDNWGDASRIGTYEIEMRATAGGADQCSGGTATASSTGLGSASAAFDNDYTTTFWASTSNANEWLRYQFASGVDVTEIVVTCYASGTLSRTVKNGKLQYSDDGSSWTDAFSFILQAPVILKQRRFPEPTSSGHRMWRLFCTDNNGGSRMHVGEIEFRATIGGADQTANVGTGDGSTSGRALASSTFTGSASGCFDNGAAYWIANSAANEWVAFVFPDPVSVEEILVGHQSGQLTNRMPKNMKLEYSDDTGGSWTTYKTFSAQTGWTDGETRVLS